MTKADTVMAADLLANDTTHPVAGTKTKYHVLVVDDEPELRQYVADELGARYHVHQAANGKEALEEVFRTRIDAVVTDVRMPVMDGVTLCRKLKGNPNLNHIPVIMLTANNRDEDNIEGLDSGADAYITKPFNIDVLLHTLMSKVRLREKLKNTYAGNQVPEEQMEEVKRDAPDEKLMQRVMKSVTAHISDPKFTVAMLCEEVGISRVHLHRKLKELTNLTTRDFIRNVRLKQAATLMEQNHYSVNELADIVGFATPNYFAQAFKELYGCSPTEYMQQWQSKQKNIADEA